MENNPNLYGKAPLPNCRSSNRAAGVEIDTLRGQMGKPKMKKRDNHNSDSDDDDTFYYRYPSLSTSAPPPSSSSSNPNPNSRPKKGSGGLAPSKSTVYVSNLDYSLTNSDLHTLFSTFGKIARVTVLKDRLSRRSRGVAFIQFVAPADALASARAMHSKVLNGRTLSASIAADNGRAPEFIKKRVYRDKSRCYECGDEGHLSYECPRNQLGSRERPAPKRGRRGDHGGGGANEGEDGFEENWASVVDGEADERLLMGGGEEKEGDGKRAKKASYFSDESDEEE